MDVNLNLLKYYYEVVKEKNITKAAEKLFITQPAMTRAIKDLESQLNTKLLDRTQKGVIPTNEGLILFEHIENILKEVNITRDIIENSEAMSDFYIGTTTSNYFNLIIDILKDFNEKYKDVRVHIVFEDISILDDMRRSGKLDIIIKNKNEILTDFKKIDEFELENFFIASKKYFPELEGKHIKIEDLLKNYPLVIMSESSPGRRNFDNFIRQKGLNFKPAYEFNSYDLCKKLVEAGIGIGIDNPINFNDKDYIFINTDKMNKRYFEFGYNISSRHKYVEKFLEIYEKKKM
ncbi:MAG: LysR family transcriptional regulator [Bacilli bacterium]|nr:LysR family transcriptional regulator [Bacilli bacterium]